MATTATVEFWQSSRDGRWYAHRKARNGQVTGRTVGGEGGGYSHLQGVRRAARREHPGLPLVRIDDPNARKR